MNQEYPLGTSVDFHILLNENDDRNIYLAQLAEKIYDHNKSSLFIFTTSLTESQMLDDFLWTFRDTSFLPHHIIDKDSGPAPILISHNTIAEDQQVLINLTATVPEFYHRFNRIIEIVSGSEDLKKLSRNKYKRYQALGCHVKTSQITSAQNSMK